MSGIIDGKAVAEAVYEGLRPRIESLAFKGVKPCLCLVLVGGDEYSQRYIGIKAKRAKALGMEARIYKLPEGTEQGKLIDVVRDLNEDNTVHGILVQLPLPPHIDQHAVIGELNPEKDVDGFHPESSGRLMIDLPSIPPCTPRGIIELIRSTGRNISGMHAVVIGRSMVVGRPTAMLLTNEDATVTLCHSKTRELFRFTKDADIIVSATGRPGLINGEMVKRGAIVIDVGNSTVDGKLVGDVDFKSVREKADFITPVPGGVGPMTIAMLMQNTVEAAELKAGI